MPDKSEALTLPYSFSRTFETSVADGCKQYTRKKHRWHAFDINSLPYQILGIALNRSHESVLRWHGHRYATFTRVVHIVGDVLARPWYVDAITTQLNYPQRLGPFQHIDPGKFQCWVAHVVQTTIGQGPICLVVNISMQSDAELLAQLFAQTLATIHPRGLAEIDLTIPDTNLTQSTVAAYWYHDAGLSYYH